MFNFTNNSIGVAGYLALNDFTQINFEISGYALGLFPSSLAILKEV